MEDVSSSLSKELCDRERSARGRQRDALMRIRLLASAEPPAQWADDVREWMGIMCAVVDLGLVAKLVANVSVRGRSLRIPCVRSGTRSP
jgi:hypothetical protein